MSGYRQVPTVSVTIAAIVADPDFAAGVTAYLDGRSLPVSDPCWEHERGRLFAVCCLRDRGYVPTDRKERIALATRYFSRGEIL